MSRSYHGQPVGGPVISPALILGLSLALSLPFAPALQAQSSDHGRDGVEFHGLGGVYLPGTIDFLAGEDSFQLDDTRLLVGARLGYVFDFGLFLEATFAYTPLRLERASGRTNLNTFIGSGVLGYNLQIMPTAQLYILAGGGVTQWVPKGLPTETQPEGVFGGGLRIFVTRGLAIRADVRDHLIPKTLSDTRATLNPALTIEDELSHNIEVSAGITLFFQTNRDSDRDRVFDRFDACPGTAAGVGADAFGCPLDGDQDGVPDHLDRCPATPVGTAVTDAGCPVDSDADGVTDDLDRCPATAVGAIVDATGCPRDADGDEVFDGIDRCPNTPDGATVDEAGCPFDSDSDGVYDGIDRCPNTPAEREVDEAGCSRVQAGLERGRLVLSSIYFQTGSAELLPQSRRVLDEVGQALLDRPEIEIEIQGHTDSVGSAAANQRLSEQRARSVFTYLVSVYPGLDRDRFVVRGYGETRPIATNETADGRAQNRRVEFVVTNPGE
ncbi:MAG: OmpA family protein [Gemmatimonadetes bacterium]|uniref:OmpA family protein n=1 Tax=Candidatus Kutchimonas denitrificans TaxID=3056748 RepID=A0AAE4Z5Q8_9BACT|nr:OmpA family protein [Gemmatimonadota bacterium]NIR73834.1 OmpA family protein [Candidatus Kutchimonas denitrificans]NIS02479.1 OmpA family protein [Gemmatimonadota bacterium]NIT68347.1 OmpA family protein [Gemmatimonadota bacterium]NIU51614.1 OmpA family protein [Gemmatimonadota bacterium]